jgi:UDP-N-acetylglucosamine--N-acetylmuramyl-(pentapeptide) pyrophosphoryl-undecaprenol N-acetylglucosamine transferase
VALPVIFAANKLGIPCLAHESDFSPGLANKLSAKKCRTVLTAFPETAKRFKNGKYGGAPIRRSVLSAKREDARKALDVPANAKVLLIFGGGSGSQAVNEALRNSLHSLTKSYFILHVCGKGNVVECHFNNYRQYEFIADMGAMYASADLVISRAGAGAIFELLALKKPSILIPLEGATRGDQWENAEYFRAKGLCRILPQSDVDKLPKAIEKALADEDMRAKLQENNFLCGNENILRVLRAELQR